MALSDVETWKFFVEQGVDIHVDGDYALRRSAENGHLEVVKYLKSLQTGE